MIALGQRGAIATNTQKGRALAQKAKFLLGYRFEEHWSEPIEAVCIQLGLSPQPEPA